MLNEGIELFDDSPKEPTQVLFGYHKMDVLRILGNSNKEYYKGSHLFLNYLELGMDVMIDSDCKVIKFILHTNHVYHPHFCFYNRCSFELNLAEVMSSPESKREE